MRLAAFLLLATAAFPQRHVTQGRAQTITENLYKCPEPVNNHRITATDGTILTVPAQTAYPARPTADLYNECAPSAPIKPVIIDPDGDLITAHIVADNYFELYVNGTLVATDNTPYTPFNSAIVQFRAKRPLTYAFKLVDWEENLGLGTELMRGDPWYPGDGGLIARFSDGTVTDHTWRAQSFYIAPLNTPAAVTEKPGNIHDTSALGRLHPHAKKPPCQDKCFAVHYPIPANWASPNFNPQMARRRRIHRRRGRRHHFQGARWIWSSNLVFDNLVLIRKTVP